MRNLLAVLLLAAGSAFAASPVVSSCAPSDATVQQYSGVFMDCSGVTDADINESSAFAFLDLLVTHSVNDAAAESFVNGTLPGSKKNLMRGPVAAYVFPNAGSFTWAVQASDGTNIAATSSSITITSADSKYSTTATVCIAANSTPAAGSGGCPAGASVINATSSYGSADFDQALTACKGATKRCLFKGGDTFTASAATAITAGPMHIGVYGTGSPTINQTYDGAVMTFSGSSDYVIRGLTINCYVSASTSNAAISGTGSFSLISVVGNTINGCGYGVKMALSDLDVLNRSGQTTTSAGSSGGSAVLSVNSTTGAANGRKVRVDTAESGKFVSTIASFVSNTSITMNDTLDTAVSSGATVSIWIDTATPTAPIWDKVFISGNTVTDLPGVDAGGANGLFVAGRRLAILDNLIDPMDGGEHGMRTSHTIKGVYVGNTTRNVLRAAMTLRSDEFGGSPTIQSSTYSGTAVVANNKLAGESCGGNGPLNGAHRGRSRNWIWESNYCASNQNSSTNILVYSGDRAVFRNNIFDMSASCVSEPCVGDDGLLIDTATAYVPSSNIWILNNTGYRSTATSFNNPSWRGWNSFLVGSGTVSNVIVKNNLCYGPLVNSSVWACAVDNSADATLSNNTGNVGTVGTNPFSATPSVDNFATFQPSVAAYATEGGTAAFPATASDFFGCFDKTGDNRIGAVVPRAQALCRGVASP